MTREHVEALRTGKMTGIYLSLLMMVGEGGPMISRTEAVVAVLDTYGVCEGMLTHLGERDSYHLDVVTAWIGLPG